MESMDIPTLIGLVGVACIIGAYFLIASGKMGGTDVRYHIINLVGAVLLLVSLYYHYNLPSVVIEFVWIAIGIYGIFRSLRKN